MADRHMENFFFFNCGYAGSPLRHVSSSLWCAGSVVVAGGLSCGMWDLSSQPGIKPGPPALGAQSLYRWTTREVPGKMFNIINH